MLGSALVTPVVGLGLLARGPLAACAQHRLPAPPERVARQAGRAVPGRTGGGTRARDARAVVGRGRAGAHAARAVAQVTTVAVLRDPPLAPRLAHALAVEPPRPPTPQGGHGPQRERDRRQ